LTTTLAAANVKELRGGFFFLSIDIKSETSRLAPLTITTDRDFFHVITPLG